MRYKVSLSTMFRCRSALLVAQWHSSGGFFSMPRFVCVENSGVFALQCIRLLCIHSLCARKKRCSKHFSLLAKSSSEPLNRTLWMERFQCTRLCVRRGELAPNTQRFNPLSYVLQPLSSRSLCVCRRRTGTHSTSAHY